MSSRNLLKKDLFGEVRLLEHHSGVRVLRDTGPARFWLRWPARQLLRREARALATLGDCDGTPELFCVERRSLQREYLAGTPLHCATAPGPAFFVAAIRLLQRIHRLGVVHNDLAKEPNVLMRTDGTPAFIDFQLAGFFPHRGRWFRVLAREDLRHVLKHKRTYCPASLSVRERRILDTPSCPSRLWMHTGKPAYLFVTRRLLGWADREGANDRKG